MKLNQRDSGEDIRRVTFRIPASLLDQLSELAEGHVRSINSEILSAIRRHLETPPVIDDRPEGPRLPREKVKPGKAVNGRKYQGGQAGRQSRPGPRKGRKAKAGATVGGGGSGSGGAASGPALPAGSAQAT